MNNLLKENEMVYVETKEEFEKVWNIVVPNVPSWLQPSPSANCYIDGGGAVYFFVSHVPNGTLFVKVPEFLARQQPAFVLPERWAVKRTPENYKVINEWANEQANSTGGFWFSDGFICGGEKHQSPIYMPERYDPRFTEITFEQFKEHVLGEKDSFLIEVNPVVSDENVEKLNAFSIRTETEPEFKWGEAVEVQEGDYDHWYSAKYIGLHPFNTEFKHVVACVKDGIISQWSQCQRPIAEKEFTMQEATDDLNKLYPNTRIVFKF